MSGEINWRQKYQELKSKYMNDIDVAFRLGVEEGMKQSSMDNMNQQMQVQAQAQNGADPSQGMKPNNNNAPGVPDQGAGEDKSGAPSIQPEEVEPASEHPEGSELDQHIAKLESLVAKSENMDPNDLRKTIDDLKSLQKSYKMQLELKKSAQSISEIAKALHKPQFKFGVQAQHNLSSIAKSAVTMQQQIITDVMQKWEDEEKKASKDIMAKLSIENIIKNEDGNDRN